MDINTALTGIVSSLKAADPYKIILFGSYAKGNATEHSDIDLMVILDSEEVAKNRKERMEKNLYIGRLVREINEEFAMDILVYSKAELRKAKDYCHFFIDEVERTGRVLYEKTG
ncbi:MAG: nucleotidyltransferase domain-containing protein [Treponemataceae bacterium]|nr:MAG: nucleotidyltransferase domain-containing protein [Treponemataceae bacterium]